MGSCKAFNFSALTIITVPKTKAIKEIKSKLKKLETLLEKIIINPLKHLLRYGTIPC